jgi:DNA-binding GntR family transcriptional regulator
LALNERRKNLKMEADTETKPSRGGGRRKRSPANAKRRSRGSGVQTVYDALKHDILEMTLPPGEALDETRLSHRFGMSRTPVREALVRLATEGLVTTLPNRNTVVSAIDFANVPVYFDALTLMYRVTGRLAALRRTEADLIEIQALQDAFAHSVETADALAMISVNRDFHLAIAHAGKNRYYTDLFRRLLDEGRRLLRIYYSTYNDHLPRRFVDEHDGIIKAIADRDPDRADRLSADHASQVIDQIQNFLASGIGANIDLRDLAARELRVRQPAISPSR